MSDPFLILHKVRGAPAFDIAERVDCPKCTHVETIHYADEASPSSAKGYDPFCDECEGHGFWWIIPTSGHRAYPYWNHKLDVSEQLSVIFAQEDLLLPAMPPDWPDHYPSKRSADKPSIPVSAMLADLGLVEKERRRG